MIGDMIMGLVRSFINWVSELVDGAWNGISSFGDFTEGMEWFWTCAGLGFPVQVIAVLVSLLAAICVVALIVKFGQKIIDWLPFT